MDAARGPPSATLQLTASVPAPALTPALQPSGLQSHGQPISQFGSPTVQIAQTFAAQLSPQFTPLHTGFTPTQTESLLVTSSPVSQGLGASYSELTGAPTPTGLVTTSVATVSVPLPVSEPPHTCTVPATTVEATATVSVSPGPTTTSASPSQPVDPVTTTTEATATVPVSLGPTTTSALESQLVDPVTTTTESEGQALPASDRQTDPPSPPDTQGQQTASSESDDGSQFAVTPHVSAPDSSPAASPPTDP